MDRQKINELGEKMFNELCVSFPKPIARDVVRLIVSKLIQEKSDKAAVVADKIYTELRGKFSRFESAIIIASAERIALNSISRQAAWSRKRRERGKCPQCGKQCDTNPHTGKPYSHCPVCRKTFNVKQAKVMLRRRADALGKQIPTTIW